MFRNKLTYSLVIFVSLLSAFLSPQLLAVVLGFAFFLSFYSAKYAIISISLAWLLTSLNPGIFASSEFTTILKQGIYFSSLAGVTWRWVVNGDRGLFQKDVLVLSLFMLYVMVTSYFVSYYPLVSMLKVTLFTGGSLSIILCYRELTAKKREDIEEWFISLFIVITLVSCPLIFTNYGYIRNGTGFQGIFNQPQLLGPIYAVFTAFVAGRMWQFNNFKWEYILLTIVGVIFIYLSESRTGLLGLILSFGLATILSLKESYKKIFSKKKFAVPAVVLLISAAPFYGSISSGISDFLLKGKQYTQIERSLVESRGDLFYSSLRNFLEDPFLGNGFGIASDPLEMIIDREPVFNIPISASAEKGVAPMALLEENGLIGAFIFILFVFYLVRKAFKSKMLYLIWPILAVFTVNFGEALIFSFNGHAGLLWIIILMHSNLGRSND